MEIDKAKLFVGGISRETSEDNLRDHFSKYGTVLGSLVAKDKNTKCPRGFGFVWFSDPSIADLALQDSHVIMGRTVEVKKAIPKSEQHQCQQQQSADQQKDNVFIKNCGNNNTNNSFRTKKIFVGGLASSLTEEQFKCYFERFGRTIDVVVMQDSSTNRPRGFGFVTFDSEESVDKVMQNTFHELNGRLVEVKRAVPKDGINGSHNGGVTRGGVRGSSDMSSQLESYSFGPGYETLPGYVPFMGYSSVGGFISGATMYGGGYPCMVGYGRPNFGVVPIVPRSPWGGSMIIGAGPSPLPYSSPCFYPTYMNGGDNNMGMMMNSYSGILGPNVNGKLNDVSVGSGCLPTHSIPLPTEGVKLEVDSSGLKVCNGGGSS